MIRLVVILLSCLTFHRWLSAAELAELRPMTTSQQISDSAHTPLPPPAQQATDRQPTTPPAAIGLATLLEFGTQATEKDSLRWAISGFLALLAPLAGHASIPAGPATTLPRTQHGRLRMAGKNRIAGRRSPDAGTTRFASAAVSPAGRPAADVGLRQPSRRGGQSGRTVPAGWGAAAAEPSLLVAAIARGRYPSAKQPGTRVAGVSSPPGQAGRGASHAPSPAHGLQSKRRPVNPLSGA